jgi:hypothetical protein
LPIQKERWVGCERFEKKKSASSVSGGGSLKPKKDFGRISSMQST